MAIYTIKKRDDCIWFNHLPEELGTAFRRLRDSEQVQVTLNGTETVWCRMRADKLGRLTPGIRALQGVQIWKAIKNGEEFTISLKTSRTNALPSIDSTENDSSRLTPTLVARNDTKAFGSYLFADYSGASSVSSQRQTIKVAYAEGGDIVRLAEGSFTRATLLDLILEKLRAASHRGIRVCLGQDHSYGFPFALGTELGIARLSWRDAVASFLEGTYIAGSPRFGNVPDFVLQFNQCQILNGRLPYFWSATKPQYGLPRRNPRPDGSGYRITDTRPNVFGRGSPMPFNRVGDPGSVGGQALWGMSMLLQLVAACDREGIALRCWPFDGLTVATNEYDDAHVLVEVYPTALRPPDVPQSDAADALYTVQTLQTTDIQGRLLQLLDLSQLSLEQRRIVSFEGWIVGATSFTLPRT